MEKPLVLVVEDDPDIRELAVMALEHGGGFDVHGCADGASAVRLARSLRPEIILLDWMLPGMDGGQILEALRADAATAAIPVVFLTAKLPTNEVEHFASLGAAGVIAKPFDPMTLPLLVWDNLNRARATKAG